MDLSFWATVVNTRIRSLRMKDRYEDRVSQFVKSRAKESIIIRLNWDNRLLIEPNDFQPISNQ